MLFRSWKVDIKSEEEKRQEVQNAIEQLSTGAPVSALIEYGLAEATVDALVKSNIGTVERLGGMTPEELEALEGIDGDAVSRIQQAINGFYGSEYGEAVADNMTAEAEPDNVIAEEAGETDAMASGTDEATAPDQNDTMVESAESAADGAVDDHLAAESGEQPVP